MLAKAHRLKRSPLFSKTLSAGRRLCSTPFFTVIGLPRQYESNTPTRFGFIISKKVSNRANKRNLARRRLREIVRETLACNAFPAKLAPYITVVLIAKHPILEASYTDLRHTWHKCIHN